MTERHNCVNVWAGAAIELFKRLQQAEESLEEAKTVIDNLEEENRKLNLELLYASENDVAGGRVERLLEENQILRSDIDKKKELMGHLLERDMTLERIEVKVCGKQQVDKNDLLKSIDNLIDQVGRLGGEVDALDNWNASLEHSIELLVKQASACEQKPSFHHIPIFTASVATAEDLKERLFELTVENTEARKLRKHMIENGYAEAEGFNLYDVVTQMLEEYYED